MSFDCFFNEAAVQQHFSLGPETAYVAYDGRVVVLPMATRTAPPG